MKAAEIQMLRQAILLCDLKTVDARLQLEEARAEELERQRPQVFVECQGVIQETLARNVLAFLVGLRETGEEPRTNFLAYVNSGLHPVELTPGGTLVADTVTVYET